VDFGANKAERPLAELVTKKLRPGDIYAHMYSGLRGELTEAERELALAAQMAPRDADVRIHLARVYRKLGIRSRTGLAARLPFPGDDTAIPVDEAAQI
jgi:hypothetical protein